MSGKRCVWRAVAPWLAVLLVVGMTACGDSDNDSSPSLPQGPVSTAAIAGTWNGTLSIAGVGDAFSVVFDCAGAFDGTVGGDAVSGQVTAFNPTTGVFSATMTIGGETRTLSGVVSGNTLTGTFTSDSGPGGNFVVSFAAGSQVVCDFSVEVSADLILAATASTCTSGGDGPYTGAGAALFTPNGDGGVDVVVTLQGPPQIALIGTSASTANPIAVTLAGLPDGASLTVTATIGGDGTTLSGTFTGGNDDCSELTGTFTGTFDL